MKNYPKKSFKNIPNASNLILNNFKVTIIIRLKLSKNTKSLKFPLKTNIKINKMNT